MASPSSLSAEGGDGLSSLSPLAQSAARDVWRYLRLGLGAQGGALRRADVLLVLGSDDARVAEHAAALFLAGLAPRILLSGRVGDITRGLYGAKSEAAFFGDVCAARGVPREAMLLEERSTNTGENLAFSLELLRERGLLRAGGGEPPFRALLVQKPYMERRALAAALRQGQGVLTPATTQVSSPDLSLEEYAVARFDAALPAPTSLRRVLATALGDLERIASYPARGFQVHQHIPQHVWEAARVLADAVGLRASQPAMANAFAAAAPPPPSTIEERVAALEARARSVQRADLGGAGAAGPGFFALSPSSSRVEDAALRAGLLGCALARVPGGYYERPLAWRAALLGCDVGALAKTLVLEAEGRAAAGAAVPASAPLAQQRYVAVIVPYNCRLNADALARAVGAPLRLAAAGEALTGFRHGGVTPLGSSTPLAVVVAKQLARRRFFWIGGGEPDVKLRVFASQLLRAGGAGTPGAAPVVLDIAEEHGEEESEQGGGGGGGA